MAIYTALPPQKITPGGELSPSPLGSSGIKKSFGSSVFIIWVWGTLSMSCIPRVLQWYWVRSYANPPPLPQPSKLLPHPRPWD